MIGTGTAAAAEAAAAAAAACPEAALTNAETRTAHAPGTSFWTLR